MGLRFPDCSGKWRSKKNGSKVPVCLAPVVVGGVSHFLRLNSQMASRRMKAAVAPVVILP